MSYKINSPVKQIWLPLDYAWLNEVIGGGANTFGNFSKAYKEKYGIDLHDLFKLIVKGTTFSCMQKEPLIGSYTQNDPNGFLFANTQAVAISNFEEPQGGAPLDLLFVRCVDAGGNTGYGFDIILPVIGTSVSSIDDLVVNTALYEL